MGDKTDIVRIKCGEIFILSTDYFSLSCEFCRKVFYTFENLRVHLNEHFPTNIKNEDSISCDSDCEIISSDIHVDMKNDLADDLQDNGDLNSTVANTVLSPRTRIDKGTYNEQIEKIETANIAIPKMQDEVHSYQLRTKHLRNTAPDSDSDATDYYVELKDSELSKIIKNFFVCPDPAKRSKKGFQCRFCSKILSSRVSRNDHENSHTGKRPHQCQQCGKTFTTYPNLCTHVNLHSDNRQFKCSVCSKKFVSNAKLKVHTRENHLSDTDPRRYFPCQLCDAKLKSDGQLHRHRQTHKSDQHIFTCDYCRRQFTTKGILAQHMRIHSGMKPYKCSYCHKKYRQSSNKIQHERRCIKFV